MSIYGAAVKAVKKGHAHDARDWDNPYARGSWVVTIGTVNVVFFRDSSAHIEDSRGGNVACILWPWRLRRALRKVGITSPVALGFSVAEFEATP